MVSSTAGLVVNQKTLKTNIKNQQKFQLLLKILYFSFVSCNTKTKYVHTYNLHRYISHNFISIIIQMIKTML